MKRFIALNPNVAGWDHDILNGVRGERLNLLLSMRMCPRGPYCEGTHGISGQRDDTLYQDQSRVDRGTNDKDKNEEDMNVWV